MLTVQVGLSCTGTMISPDIVLTADHCVRANVVGPCSADSVPETVTSDYRADGTFNPVSITVSSILERHDCSESLDFALLKLDSPLMDWRSTFLSDGETSDPVVALGFANGGGLRAGIGSLLSANTADVDVMGGYSGGPILNAGQAQAGLISEVDCSGVPQVAGFVTATSILSVPGLTAEHQTGLLHVVLGL